MGEGARGNEVGNCLFSFSFSIIFRLSIEFSF